MLILFIFTSIMLSLIFNFLTHPLSIGLILLLQTITTALILGFYSSNLWFSYILFMIMIGGMMVLFIYMTSIASNEKFYFSKFVVLTIMFIMMIMIFMLFKSDLAIFSLNTFSMNKIKILEPFMFEKSFNKFYFIPSNMILLSLMIYLFITLIAVVKITNINSGPLRQKF